MVPEGQLALTSPIACQGGEREADVIYTDVWTSMGQEKEADKRRREFAAYQVNGALLKSAPAHVKVMHCLPAHRGEEITPEVLDGPASVVFQQAGNRMHAQKALTAVANGIATALASRLKHDICLLPGGANAKRGIGRRPCSR